MATTLGTQYSTRQIVENKIIDKVKILSQY